MATQVTLAEEGLVACQDAEMPFLKGIEAPGGVLFVVF